MQQLDATNHDDIRATYESVGIAQAYRQFHEDGLEPDDIKAALGTDVARQFASWLFFRRNV